MGTNTSSENPWGEHVEADNIVGDWWFINQYPQWRWAVAGLLLVTIVPVGAFMLAYQAVNCLYREDMDITADVTPTR